MPQGEGTYGSTVGRPPKKGSPGKWGFLLTPRVSLGPMVDPDHDPLEGVTTNLTSKTTPKGGGKKAPGKSLSDEDPFKMRSGNSPLFKHMGSSLLYKNFGVGRKVSTDPTSPNKITDAAILGGVDAMGRKGGEGSEFVKGAEKQQPVADASGQTNPWTNRVALDEHIALGAKAAHAAEAQGTGGGASTLWGFGSGLGVIGGGGTSGGSGSTSEDPLNPPAGGGGGGSWIWGPSDVRLKEKIKRTGKSPSGIPIYEFNYIGDSNRYSGAMAQDLLEMNIDAVSMDESGYYKVNYNNIDVDMHLIN